MHQIRWTIPKIRGRLNLIQSLVYQRRAPLPPFRLIKHTSPADAPALDADPAAGELVCAGDHWVEPDLNFTLLTTFTLPADWPDEPPLALYLPLGNTGDFSHPEALAYVDGTPLSSCDRHHQEVILPETLRDGREHTLALHGWTGLTWSGKLAGAIVMGECAVVQVSPACRAFITVARVALEAAEALDTNSVPRGHLLNALDAAFKRLDTRDPLGAAFYDSLPAALETLQAGIAESGAPLDVTVYAAGHAHIDVAWLWTLGQTRHKAQRTFSNVLSLMRQFPDFRFTQSQPQLYEYIRQDSPGLFEQIQKQVREGRWELTGGMWVEADCNLTGSESLARQFLLGRGFFRQHFGPVDTPILWLPDVFGYAWNLPQLIKEAGLEYFFTIKIGWNQYNKLPYDSFWWQGLDGTKVLTHFSTTHQLESSYAATYNAAATPDEVLGTWHHFQQKEQQHSLLMSYGYGDGGGGPTREMLENIELMRDFPGMPRTVPSKAIEFFRQMEAESGDILPTWNGELYLELHRGTYTTQARNKRANRKSEFLLHDAEFLATLAAHLDAGYTYPAGAFREAWQVVCLNQFHDIIPGSSITPVYEESQAQYAAVREDVTALQNAALDVIARHAGGDVLLINPTSFERDDLVFWPGRLEAGERLETAGGTVLAVQPASDGTWIAPGTLPPYSVTPLGRVRGAVPASETALSASPQHLENALIRVEFNADGDITRIFDKAGRREVLPEGQVANQLQAFEDRPMNWDAWDIDIYYDDKLWPAEPADSITVVEAGPLRAALRITRRILNSTLTQTISLTRDSARLDIETVADWRERHILLKTTFPVDILAPAATYEIQWGHVQRPTHRNTSWDWARFETCAHKWVDLSEQDYGVSLLNDCKYGHDIRDNVMRISLLRSPSMPDPTADLGEHRFTYSLLPHSGGAGHATIAAAYALNNPALAVTVAGASTPAEPHSFIRTERENIVIETIKQAEDGRGVIVRLYESLRQRGSATLRTGFPLEAAWRVNLLEEDGAALDILPDRHGVTFAFRPFEIITLRLVQLAELLPG